LSEGERARLQVKADNLQYIAMTTYMTKTFAYGPKATEKELDFLKYNKEEAMNKYGNDEKSYEQSIANLQEMVDKRKSPDQVYAESKERDATNEAIAEGYDQKKGKMNKGFDTPIKMIALMKRIDETPQNSKKSKEAAYTIKAGIEKNLVASIHAEPAFDVSDKEAVLTGRPQSALKTATRSVRSAYDNLTGKETRDVYVGTGENGIRNFEIQRVKVPKSGNEALTQSVERKYLLAADQVDTKITRESYLRQPEVMAEYASIISGVTERATAAGIDLDSKIPADIAMVTKFTDDAILEVAQNTYPESSLAIMQEYKDKNVPNAFIANKIRQNAKKNIVITNIASTPKGVTNEVNNKVSEWLSGN